MTGACAGRAAGTRSTRRLFGSEPISARPKGGINDHLATGDKTVDSDRSGSKCEARYSSTAATRIPPERRNARRRSFRRHVQAGLPWVCTPPSIMAAAISIYTVDGGHHSGPDRRRTGYIGLAGPSAESEWTSSGYFAVTRRLMSTRR